MRMTWLVVGAVVLAGCMTREEQLAGFRAQCERDFGLRPGSDAFGACVQRQDIARREAIGRALAAPQAGPR
jgi:hypothetical protein